MSSVNYSQWMYVQCKECQKKCETDIDVKAHFERVHEFGESLRIYPCELCGFEGDDVTSIKNIWKNIIEMFHQNHNTSNNCPKLQREETKYKGIVIDNEGNINVAD